MRLKPNPKQTLEAILGYKENHYGYTVYWKFPVRIFDYVVHFKEGVIAITTPDEILSNPSNAHTQILYKKKK